MEGRRPKRDRGEGMEDPRMGRERDRGEEMEGPRGEMGGGNGASENVGRERER